MLIIISIEFDIYKRMGTVVKVVLRDVALLFKGKKIRNVNISENCERYCRENCLLRLYRCLYFPSNVLKFVLLDLDIFKLTNLTC